MKNLIFIACFALVSCQYENELPAPVEFSQPEYRQVSNQLDSVRINLTSPITTQGGTKLNMFTYTATQSATANIKLSLMLSNPSYGFKYYITKNGKEIGVNNVGNQKDFNGVREIVIVDVPLSNGDVIESYVGYASAGVTTVHNGYFLIETF